jgi:hypothetical protein
MSIKTMNKDSRTRVDVIVKKGAEELFPEVFYRELPASGLWIEEKETLQSLSVTLETSMPS